MYKLLHNGYDGLFLFFQQQLILNDIEVVTSVNKLLIQILDVNIKVIIRRSADLLHEIRSRNAAETCTCLSSLIMNNSYRNRSPARPRFSFYIDFIACEMSNVCA